jgi:drug/metabolite transporter, DME family
VDKGFFYILAAAVLWGTTGTAQALAPEGAHPLSVGALRLVIGGLALQGVLAARRKENSGCRLPRGPILLSAACMAAYQLFFFAGVARTGVAVGTMVGIGSAPVIAGLLGTLAWGERLTRRWWLATLLAIAGCVLLAGVGREIHTDPVGIVFAISAGCMYALFSVLSKRLLETFPVERVYAAVFGIGALVMAPILVTQDLSWLAMPGGWATMLWLGLAATALAYLLFGSGLRHTPVAAAVTLSLAEPLTASALAVLVLGEEILPITALGMALIFSGLLVLSFKKPGAPM